MRDVSSSIVGGIGIPMWNDFFPVVIRWQHYSCYNVQALLLCTECPELQSYVAWSVHYYT